MDEMKLLRDAGGDGADLVPDARRSARSHLVAHFAAEPIRRRRSRVAVAVVAVAVVAPAFGASLDGGDGLPAPSVAAANPILMRAAERVAEAPPMLAPRGDQYIYRRILLVETDPRGEVERFEDEQWESVSGSGPSRSTERGRTWITQPSEGIWPPRDYEALADLPTEPEALRRVVIDSFGGPGIDTATDHETEFMGLMQLLRVWQPVMPGGLRAAAVRALAQLPEVHVREGVADARGRKGLGISAPALHDSYEHVVDPSTFQELGMRGSLQRNDGVVVSQRTAVVEARIVDELGQRP